jgi:flagellar biosynthetic protein FlhB
VAEDHDDSQKTEEPSAKRLADALEKGDIVKSQEIVSWMTLAAGTLLLVALSSAVSREIGGVLKIFLEAPEGFATDPVALIAMVSGLLRRVGAILALPALLLLGGSLAGHLIQHRPMLTLSKLVPKLDKISPMAGMKRLFGGQAVANFLKGLAKLLIVGAAAFAVLWPERAKLGLLIAAEPAVLLPAALTLSVKVLGTALAILAVVAGADYFFQRQAFYKRNRMTKQEVKEEFRQSEGDPMVKAKIRQIRGERAKRRMMAAVPTATVVVTNPTHFAVALKYEQGSMAAPTCVAKGADKVALRIRELALEHKVPVIEDPPLARALYATVDLDAEIPAEHYKAVAGVIGYVMRLKMRTLRPGSR